MTHRDGNTVFSDFDLRQTAIGWLVEKVVEQNYAKYEIEFILKPS